MEYAAIFHDMNKRYCYALEKGKFLIRIQTKKNDVSTVVLHYRDKYLPLEVEDTRMKIMMTKAASDQYHDFYEAEVACDVICLRYYFELVDSKGRRTFYGNYEFFEEPIDDIDRMFDCPQNLREEELFEVPRWAKNKVIYQIFPSRFATDRKVPEELWYKEPIGAHDRLEGNLRGIINHLDHLQELGIDVIYLNPIFASNSTHKYDTIDYYQIDPSFGTREDFRELVDRAHSMGIRIILDAVFNHTSPEFLAFEDIRKNGADSEYLDWYFIDSFPLDGEEGKKPRYKTFGYYDGMPKLNLKNPKTEEYFIRVGRYWIKEFHIDGWRLDVGDEISHRFWKRFRNSVKEVNPDALIIGEVWHYAGDFLEGDEWDSVMNYPFYLNVRDFVAQERITASQFLGNMDFVKARSNNNAYPVLVNLLDSHDTPRFLNSCADTARQSIRLRDGDVLQPMEIKKKKQRLGAAFLLLSPGMPMIYYGDEYGMDGADDPDCRRGMLWDEARQDKEMYQWYRKLIQIRKAHPVITEGRIAAKWSLDEEGVVVIRKQYGKEQITMIFHNGAVPTALETASLIGVKDLLSGAPFVGTIGSYEVLLLLEQENIYE